MYALSALGYSTHSSRDMSPDAGSPYAERPIRPLPKRRLRERLSPDVAESIKYPPAPKTITPLFYHPYNLREDIGAVGITESPHPSERERADEIERNYISRRNGDEIESDEDEAAYRSRIYSRHSVDTTGRSYRYVQKPDSKHANPQPPASATSSADGYDSFENTNNKKKRKIPTPGDSNLNGTHHSGESTGIGMPVGEDAAEEISSGISSYHTVGSLASQGMSGPGRGRYGRIRNGRSPLRTLSDSSGNWGNGRTTKQRQSQWPASSKIRIARLSRISLTNISKPSLQESSHDQLQTRMLKNSQLHRPVVKKMLVCYNYKPQRSRAHLLSSLLPVTLKFLVPYRGLAQAQQHQCFTARLPPE